MTQDFNKISSRVIEIAENVILLIIGIATLYAATVEAIRMISTFEVNLSDLFLLFIYGGGSWND